MFYNQLEDFTTSLNDVKECSSKRITNFFDIPRVGCKIFKLVVHTFYMRAVVLRKMPQNVNASRDMSYCGSFCRKATALII